jgi:hypothetical protein
MADTQEKAKARAARKKRVAVWNRRLAWVTFPTLVVGTLFYYGPAARWWPAAEWWGMALINIFTLMFLAHSVCSVYLFGFPKFKRNVRIYHIYIGYAVFVFTFLSQGLIGFEPYHKIAYAINWVFIIIHVSLSARFMLQRGKPKPRDPELAYYAGGKLLRDAAAD